MCLTRAMADIPNTYRFFVPPALLASDDVTLTDSALLHQLSRVLRVKVGAHLLLLDGAGGACVVAVTHIERGAIRGQVHARQAAGGELPVQLTLAAPLLRGERFEWLLQKGTELGVTRFVPVLWQRSEGGDTVSPTKHERWQRIIREAAEQACRGHLPSLSAPQPAAAVFATRPAYDHALLLYEGSPTVQPPLLRDWLRAQPPLAVGGRVLVCSGAEGGIAPDELTAAHERGIIPVSLGTRILRAETAPIMAAAVYGYEYDTRQPGTHAESEPS